ncbi:hypothetical protein H072_6909 [Dactylellina haptotyla CBS 200.50]|uniref:Uncharacterized protein n=1 Tax=Dactylellina haptotyla (strain CBS 200.50) TaxID=1284197 RepID=S8A8U9_DACHA|nr:hypothetical protein H072_6909 [Dactylellina haptotyla CBS 200.50]
MPSTRSLLTSGAGILAVIAGPGIVTGVMSSFGDPIIGLPIASGVGIVITAIGTIIIYIRDRRASRRALEKSVFGKVLNRIERKDLKPQYKAAKARAKADDKAERAALKAEEKIRKKELKKVIKDRLRKKVKDLPLKVVLGIVRFINTLVIEIPKASVADLEADASGIVQGAVQPIPNVPGPDDLLAGKSPGTAGPGNTVTNFATSPAGTVGNTVPVVPSFASTLVSPPGNVAGSLPVTPI